MTSEIRFYSTREPFGEFSKFAPFPIEVAGKVWPTSEHYFQRQKFAGTEHEEEIRLTDSPMVAAKMGRDRKRPLRADWEVLNDDVMCEAVAAKLNQHLSLGRLLPSTGNRILIEHTNSDSYWGEGGDGSGEEHARNNSDGSQRKGEVKQPNQALQTTPVARG